MPADGRASLFTSCALVSRPGLSSGSPRVGHSKDGVLWAGVPCFLSVLRSSLPIPVQWNLEFGAPSKALRGREAHHVVRRRKGNMVEGVSPFPQSGVWHQESKIPS